MRCVLTEDIVGDIQGALTRSPQTSLRRFKSKKHSLGSAYTAVRKMLKFYTYWMQIFHELKLIYYNKCVQYANGLRPSFVAFYFRLLVFHRRDMLMCVSTITKCVLQKLTSGAPVKVTNNWASFIWNNLDAEAYQDNDM